MQPFGYDVKESVDNDHMPHFEDCMQEASASLLSSGGGKWLEVCAERFLGCIAVASMRANARATDEYAYSMRVRLGDLR